MNYASKARQIFTGLFCASLIILTASLILFIEL